MLNGKRCRNRNSRWMFGIGYLFFIRCWTFDVRCSSFSSPFSAYGKESHHHQRLVSYIHNTLGDPPVSILPDCEFGEGCSFDFHPSLVPWEIEGFSHCCSCKSEILYFHFEVAEYQPLYIRFSQKGIEPGNKQTLQIKGLAGNYDWFLRCDCIKVFHQERKHWLRPIFKGLWQCLASTPDPYVSSVIKGLKECRHVCPTFCVPILSTPR